MPEPNAPVVVVSGAAGRLGSRLVSGYIDAGYNVVGLDRTVPEDGNVHATWLSMNGLDESSVRAAFASVFARHARIDSVIHTVGMWGMSPLEETSLDDWKRMIDVNLTSTFLCFREAVKHMKAHGGRLVGIASQQGVEHGVAGQGAYSAAKSGVIRLVESIASEYAGSGITAHALAPSTILFGDETSEGVRVDDLVSACLYLSSPAGAALNGSVLRAFGAGS